MMESKIDERYFERPSASIRCIEKVLETYAKEIGTPPDPQQDLRDMLTDMMHYWRDKFLTGEFDKDWYVIYEIAKANFYYEVEVLKENRKNES